MESDRLTKTTEKPASDFFEELHAVRDSVEELYFLLDHIWRNRNELRDILEETMEEKEEIIVCCHCNASPPSLAEAIQEGWTDFQYDDGTDWNYLAICPDCQQEQVVNERETSEVTVEKSEQQRLF